MTVRTFLDISTAHVKPSTMALINMGAMSMNTLIGDHGAMLHVPSDNTLVPNYPEDLLTVLDHARKLNCDYVLLDGDADLVETLPDYADEWD